MVERPIELAIGIGLLLEVRQDLIPEAGPSPAILARRYGEVLVVSASLSG